jgi:superoxide dismutase
MNKRALYSSVYMNFPYTLPPLDYAYGALEPYVDEQTMHLHHDKHHQTYIDNANKVVADYPELQKKTLVELFYRKDSAVFLYTPQFQIGTYHPGFGCIEKSLEIAKVI